MLVDGNEPHHIVMYRPQTPERSLFPRVQVHHPSWFLAYIRKSRVFREWMAHVRLVLPYESIFYPISTLVFLRLLLITLSSAPEPSSADAANTMMRRQRFLFSRCLRTSCETAIAVWRSIYLLILLAAI